MAETANPCDVLCSLTDPKELNRLCECTLVDVMDVRESLGAGGKGAKRLDPTLHANLFSPYALFVDRESLALMEAVAQATFSVAQNPMYADRVLGWAPEIARHDPGSIGGVLGLDFHLTVAGPRLIEINTNPGGLLLNAVLLESVRSCAPSTWLPWTSGAQAREASVTAWLEDARAQLGRMPTRMAIVDLAPHEQFLYPEFELYAEAFRERGVDSAIRAPDALRFGPNGFEDAQGQVDAVYNRLTDFSLADQTLAPLHQAYLAQAIALTPHPRAHALFADKRNLAVLGDANLLDSWGVDPLLAQRLARVIPPTVEVTAENRDGLWAERAGYFFKPATGFGSRGSYRGDKLTRRVWDSMPSTSYVAQAFAPPSVRIVHGGASLKADVRCFASASGVLLYAARLYQGQTTNMRTLHGGFAAVLTTPVLAG